MRLSDDVLLIIFRYYLDASPRLWPRLVHICRKWRHIVFTSQQVLHLRLFCSSGTPVSTTLDCWPPIPIVTEYGGSLALDPPSPEDEANIIAALKRSDRVNSISLTITTSLLDKLYEVHRPFLELDDLILLSRDLARDNVPLTLPSSFRWGPRLRRLHLTRVAFPAHPRLLYSSRDLVDVKLHEALDFLNPPIEELADALSWMPQLRSLSLLFPSTDHFPPSPWPDRRVVLPALTRLKFQGPVKYLDRLILRVNAPRLEVIQVTVYDQFLNNLSILGKFVDQIEQHKSHRQARILSSERAISLSLTHPQAATCFKFQILTVLLSEQLYAMSNILPNFSAFLLHVEDLHISATRPSTQKNGLCSARWPEILDSFIGVKWLHLDVDDSTNVVRALQGMSWRSNTCVLPALYKLYLPQPGSRHARVSEGMVSFMTSRWHSGYPIAVEYERRRCISELHGGGTSLCTEPNNLVTFLEWDL